MALKVKPLKEFSIIRCADGEKILCVQRQHPIAFITSIVLQIIAALFTLVSLIYILGLLGETTAFTLPNSTLIGYLTFVIISTLLITETFTFLSWYFEFYVITNKQIVHRYSFRIFGSYTESVYGEKMHIQEIERRSSNLIYDFLKIQDVYVYFHKLERENPFIFKTPEDAQVVDDVLQDLIVSSKTLRRNLDKDDN